MYFARKVLYVLNCKVSEYTYTSSLKQGSNSSGCGFQLENASVREDSNSFISVAEFLTVFPYSYF